MRSEDTERFRLTPKGLKYLATHGPSKENYTSVILGLIKSSPRRASRDYMLRKMSNQRPYINSSNPFDGVARSDSLDRNLVFLESEGLIQGDTLDKTLGWPKLPVSKVHGPDTVVSEKIAYPRELRLMELNEVLEIPKGHGLSEFHLSMYEVN
jgi:hypothetical protein